MLTYDDIARMIEPVATRFEDDHYTSLSIGACKVERDCSTEWDFPYFGLGPSEEALADLACMELVRRLNAKGHIVYMRPGVVHIIDAGGMGTGGPYTTHPLEAVARFAAEVLGKEAS